MCPQGGKAFNEDERRCCPRNTQAGSQWHPSRSDKSTISANANQALVWWRPKAGMPQAPRLFPSGIMRSDLLAKSADDSASTETAPHNAPLRIISFMRCTA